MARLHLRGAPARSRRRDLGGRDGALRRRAPRAGDRGRVVLRTDVPRRAVPVSRPRRDGARARRVAARGRCRCRHGRAGPHPNGRHRPAAGAGAGPARRPPPPRGAGQHGGGGRGTRAVAVLALRAGWRSRRAAPGKLRSLSGMGSRAVPHARPAVRADRRARKRAVADAVDGRGLLPDWASPRCVRCS